MTVEMRVDVDRLRALSKHLRAESNSKALRKDLVTDIRAAVAPGVSKVQGKLRAVPHETAAHPSPSIGTYLASRTRPVVKLTGWSAGVRVRIPQTPQLRGFKLAARRFNRTHWRHKVFGRDVWVEQQSPIPGYFDDTLFADREKYRAAVYAALRKHARRLGEFY
jgi:hypothetical protein